MSGAFLMSREIFNHDIWNDVPKFRIFFYIVGNAVFSEQGVTKGGIQIGRGQYLRSYRNIREDLVYVDKNAEKYYSLNTIKSKIDDLVKNEMLTIEETRLGTLFTVVNYQKYQGFEHYKNVSTEQQKNSNGTATEQQQNNNNYVNKGIKDINATAATSAQAPESSGPTDYQQRLLHRYVQLRGYGFDPTPKDIDAAKEISKAGVPLDLAIKAMEKKFAEYAPRHDKDRINSLSYCAGAIYDAYHQPAAMPKKTTSQEPQYKYNDGF